MHKPKSAALDGAGRRKARALARRLRKTEDARRVVLVCHSCGPRSARLLDWLHGVISADPSLADRVVVRPVGCLGPCPKKKRVTVAVGGRKRRHWRRGWIAHADKGRKRLWKALRKGLA